MDKAEVVTMRELFAKAVDALGTLEETNHDLTQQLDQANNDIAGLSNELNLQRVSVGEAQRKVTELQAKLDSIASIFAVPEIDEQQKKE